MIEASTKWANLHKQKLLPESFVEISFDVTDEVVDDITDITIYATAKAAISNQSSVLGTPGTPTPANYATLEHNLWVLDGTREIVPDSEPYDTPGYVSADDSNGLLRVVLPEARTQKIPGVTIIWSSEYDEYPTEFVIQFSKDGTAVSSTTVRDNTSSVSEITVDAITYDSMIIQTYDWNMPDHRRRIDRVFFGYVLTFGKTDIVSYKHEQHGSLLNTELPKNSITFSLSNVDGRWNLANPDGIGQYLCERQRIKVRYGLDVNGKTEWVKAGTFYLSEWNAPSNGLEAKFVARDVFEFLLNETTQGVETEPDTKISEKLNTILATAGAPNDVEAVVPDIFDVGYLIDDGDVASEAIQRLASYLCLVVWQNRDGALEFKRIMPYQDYTLYTPDAAYQLAMKLPFDVMYSHPEIELSKPLREVRMVIYTEHFANKERTPTGEIYVLSVGDTGEVITIDNKYEWNNTDSNYTPTYTRDILLHRRIVSGEFRADPRLDVFDVIDVESKYGTLENVVLTDITYTYNGSFRGTFTGRVLGPLEE